MLPDPSLAARILSRQALRYTGGADQGLDRPAHIRGGSRLAWIAGRIVLVQDDANFLAMVDPCSGEAVAVSLRLGLGLGLGLEPTPGAGAGGGGARVHCARCDPREGAGLLRRASNLEGAIQIGSRLRLFSRGNGSPADGLLPVDATCDISLGRLLSHLRDPERSAVNLASIA